MLLPWNICLGNNGL